jgi:hypothetical protein
LIVSVSVLLGCCMFIVVVCIVVGRRASSPRMTPVTTLDTTDLPSLFQRVQRPVKLPGPPMQQYVEQKIQPANACIICPDVSMISRKQKEKVMNGWTSGYGAPPPSAASTRSSLASSSSGKRSKARTPSVSSDNSMRSPSAPASLAGNESKPNTPPRAVEG